MARGCSPRPVGVGLRHLQQRLAASGKGIPDRFLIHYAGLLAQKPIPAANIAALVRGFFAVDARVESFVGQWMNLPITEQSALDGRPCLLGQNAFVGERLWDRQNKIRLELGPLDQAQFASFLPGQDGLLALRELVQFCVGLTLDCDVTLVVKRDEADTEPSFIMKSKDEKGDKPERGERRRRDDEEGEAGAEDPMTAGLEPAPGKPRSIH